MKGTAAVRTAVWTAAVTALWAALVVFVGIGLWTSYVVAYFFGGDPLLLTAQGGPGVALGAALAAFLLVFVAVRFVRAPSVVWLAVPLGHSLVLLTVMVPTAAHNVLLDALAQTLRSDVPVAVLAAGAAYFASRFGLGRVSNMRVQQTRRSET